MKLNPKKLKALSAIAKLKAEQSLAEVAKASRDLNDAQRRVQEVAQHRQRLMQSVEDPIQAAQLARQAERLRRTQAEASQKISHFEARLEDAKKKATPAFGRKTVLDRFVALAEGEAKEKQ